MSGEDRLAKKEFRKRGSGYVTCKLSEAYEY